MTYLAMTSLCLLGASQMRSFTQVTSPWLILLLHKETASLRWNLDFQKGQGLFFCFALFCFLPLMATLKHVTIKFTVLV